MQRYGVISIVDMFPEIEYDNTPSEVVWWCVDEC